MSGTLHQYDYLFALGTIFSLLDAFNIGANDVANSFATSVSSKSLTLRQATVLAAICEFLGGVLASSKVASTIKNGIIDAASFQGNAPVQLLGFVCAITASATWLMIATKKSWPVSTTYSIVSALIGVGIATGGADVVKWDWNNGKGVATIFAGFIIAPGLSAGFGAVVYLITKFGVMMRKNTIRAALYASPLYFFGVTAILTMSIIYKGAPELKLNKLPEVTMALGIVLTGLVVSILSVIFWLPYVYGKVVRNDYTLRWYHIFYGPLLWRRQAPADAKDGLHSAVPDYTIRDRTAGDAGVPLAEKQMSLDRAEDAKEMDTSTPPSLREAPRTEQLTTEEIKAAHFTPLKPGPWHSAENLWILISRRSWQTLTYGTTVDVHSLQASSGNDKEAERIVRIHAHAKQFDNETEHLYSFLQVMTACTASFAHGSNDLANAMGPYATIYYVWSTGLAAGKETPTPTWLIVVGAVALCIGLATYGYNIMKVLGNKLTLHSPSRGFSMELGSAITVLLASQYGIPVSTTMCITGSTIGVALCNGEWRSLNWRAIGWIFLGWVLTVPIASVGAGCLMGMLLNAPHF